MSSATQILFNSPALHSLKRDQLVKLCKTHSLKANGKNVELIQRLKEHAKDLPKDSPLSIAARSEAEGPTTPEGDVPMDIDDNQKYDSHDIDDQSYHQTHTRASEQWEMVMDSIQEEDEHGPSSSQSTLSSQRTLNNASSGAGEFGTAGSKSSAVSSSIRALATSLGLKRSTSSKSSAMSTSSSKHGNKGNKAPPFAALSEINDELAQTSTPYSSLPQNDPPPQTDHFVLNSPTRESLDGTSEPLPGHVLRPGVPAPKNARLSLGLGLGSGSVPATPSRQDTQPTTTIRLISNPLTTAAPTTPTREGPFNWGFPSNTYAPGINGTPQLQPFHTTFDLVLGSPEAIGRASNVNGNGTPGFYQSFTLGGSTIWPPPDTPTKTPGSIYPRLTSDLVPTMPSPSPLRFAQSSATTPAPQPPSPTPKLSNKDLQPPPPIPFVFGSPDPRHSMSNTEFRNAAASVLEEMNKRLRADGVDEMTVGIIDKLHPGAAPSTSDDITSREVRPLPGSAKKMSEKEKFDKIHRVQEKNGMEGIDQFVKRREGLVAPPPGLVGKKRKSSVLADDLGKGASRGPRASGTRVISAGRRAKALPGAFGMDEDDEEDDEDEDRPGKRARTDPEGEGQGAPIGTDGSDQRPKTKREQAEMDAVKRKLEATRAARRRSSAVNGARKSVGRPRVSGAAKLKPKPSKFGFLSTAKSIVASVWNRGGKQPTPAPGPSSSLIPKPLSSSGPSTKPDSSKTQDKPTMPPVSVPTSSNNKRPTLASTRTSATTNASAGSRATALRNIGPKPSTIPPTSTFSNSKDNEGSTSSRRARSPLPSFDHSGSTFGSGSANARPGASSAPGTATTRSSRFSSLTRTTSPPGTFASSRVGASSGVSSIGTRLSTRTSNSAAPAPAGVGSMGTKRTSATGTTGTRSSAMSRLLAPTASSLAKVARRPSVATTSSRGGTPQPGFVGNALGSITNSLTATSTPPTTTTGTGTGRRGIFSKPICQPSGIPVPSPVKRNPAFPDVIDSAKPPSSSAASTSNGSINSLASANANANGDTVQRTRTLSGHKPRISRSKVITRLASQRKVNGVNVANGLTIATPRSNRRTMVVGRKSGPGGAAAVGSGSGSGAGLLVPRAGKARSSLGVRGNGLLRASYGGGASSARSSFGGGGNVLLSAKKRARQSEIAKRRSRVAAEAAAGEVMVVGDDA